MSNLSMQIPAIRALVKSKHKAYIEKFGAASNMIEGELELSRTRILAKLVLLSKPFTSAGVIYEAEEIQASSRDGAFPMSMRWGKKGNPLGLYLLNTGSDVILSDSVGLALTLETIETRMVLVTDAKRVCKRFVDVLNPDFNWLDMASSILDAIHETIYDKREAMIKNFINGPQ